MGQNEAKTKPTAIDPQAFVDAVDNAVRREDAKAIDAMMRRVSGEQPRMWGPTMIGYGDYHYRYDSGHEGDTARMGFSPRKAELVLYVLGAYGDRQQEEDALLARLGKHRRGKSCLYIRRLNQVDMDALEALARLNWEVMAARYPA